MKVMMGKDRWAVMVAAAKGNAKRPPRGCDDVVADFAVRAMKDKVVDDEVESWERRVLAWAGVRLPSAADLAAETVEQLLVQQRQAAKDAELAVREAELTALAATRTVLRYAPDDPWFDSPYRVKDQRWVLHGTGFVVGRWEEVQKADGATRFAEVVDIKLGGGIEVGYTSQRRRPREGELVRRLDGTVETVPA